MKVVFTIDTLVQGGTEQSIRDLIRHFSHDVNITVIYFYPRHDLLIDFQQLNIEVVFLDLKGKYDWIAGIKKLKRELINRNPDIVVSSLYRSNIISRLACKSTGHLLVGTFVEDSYSKERRKTFRGLGAVKYQITWLIDRLTAKYTGAWISNSNYIALQNKKKLGIPGDRIHVIYRGRNAELFRPWEPQKSESFIFATIGRLYEKKGYPELLDAFATVVHAHPQARLVIYGEGSYRKEIENKIVQLSLAKHVLLAGNVAKAWTKLYEAHCFIFPSRFEGFSGALVEAMMTGIPIICSDIPMNLEAVENNKTAIVHTVGRADDISSKMIEVINHYDSMMIMGTRARKVAIKKFDIKNIAGEYENLLRQLVKMRTVYTKFNH